MYNLDGCKEFKANRPFIYHVWDRKTKTAIISGQVMNLKDKFE